MKDRRQRHSQKRNAQRNDSEIEYPANKICCRCQAMKPACEFPKARWEKDGLKSYCKACGSIARHDWYQRNRDREIAKTVAWGRENPEKKRKQARRTYLKNHESRKTRNRMAYEEQKTTILQQSRTRYATDAKYRNKLLKQAAARYAKAPERTKEYRRRYREENREKVNMHANAARCRKAEAPGHCTLEEWLEILDYFNFHCAYCVRPEHEVGPLTIDHMTPLSRGGTNDPENLVPACKSCNSSKNHRTVLEFLGNLHPPRRTRQIAI